MLVAKTTKIMAQKIALKKNNLKRRRLLHKFWRMLEAKLIRKLKPRKMYLL